MKTIKVIFIVSVLALFVYLLMLDLNAAGQERPARRIKVYFATSTTITNGMTNQYIFPGLETAWDLLVQNDGGNTVSIVLNNITNNLFPVKTSEGISITGVYMTNLFVINTSGANNTIRILAFGEPK